MVAPGLTLRLGLAQKGKHTIVGLAGNHETLKVVELPEIGFASTLLEPCQAAVFEVSNLGLPIELLLGVNAFRNQRLQFDFKEGRIYVIE